jgi:signal transduction histidine kinase
MRAQADVRRSGENRGEGTHRAPELGYDIAMAYRLRPRSIHGELALLVGVLVLPFVAMTAYLLYAQAQRDLEEARAVVRRLAESHADRAARFVADTRAVLQAVARRPLVRAMDPARCDPGLRELLDLYPKAANFLVVDREGRILCGAIPPPPERVVRIADEALLREVLATGSFALSRPIVGRISKRWVIAAVQPVLGEDGAIAGTVSMSIDLVDWNLLLQESALPKGAVVALVSGSLVIARSSEAAQWIGRDVAGSEIMAHVGSGTAGVIRALGATEIERFWGLREVPGTDWSVLAGLPAEQVLGPVRQRTTKGVLFVSLVVVVVVAVAIAFARRLARPVGRIASALRLRAAGREDVPIPVSGPREIAAMARELNRGFERSARSQQLFAALSEVNETVVRVREREELFRQVCRICVERMRFLVASVALVDGTRRRIVPRVYAGPGSRVLRDIDFPLDAADPLSTTVTSTAVRTKRAAVANDVDADPEKVVARPIRERIGSKSRASFPLFEGGDVIGALTVHSEAPDFFDASIVELLTRMADDISFALDKLAEQIQLGALTRGLEERVRRRTAELEAANLELEAFSYSVSHDLRAPVRHVDGFVRLLEKELAPPSAKVAHYLATISAAARRMGALIDDLLTLSRTGRQSLELRCVDLGAMVRELIRELGPETGQRGVQWTLDELPLVMADASLLRIVLHNLLSNALKYSRAQPVARIAVEARAAQPGTVEVTVRDNGVGFDARFKDKLFGVFQRLHREEEFEGTGIGLATARRIVHRHGHRIWAVGELGKGAAFTFTITQAEVAHAGSAHLAG